MNILTNQQIKIQSPDIDSECTDAFIYCFNNKYKGSHSIQSEKGESIAHTLHHIYNPK